MSNQRFGSACQLKRFCRFRPQSMRISVVDAITEDGMACDWVLDTSEMGVSISVCGGKGFQEVLRSVYLAGYMDGRIDES